MIFKYYSGDWSWDFVCVGAVSIGDPTLAAIEIKLSKVYRTNFPIHLLAFIDLNPMSPDHIWLPNAVEYVERNIKQSQFEQIWIFDFHKNKIKYSSP